MVVTIDISTKRYPNTVTVIDDVDADRVLAFRWTPHTPGGLDKNKRKNVYAVRAEHPKHPDGTFGTKMVLLHRFILDAPKGVQVDHRNYDTLDNRRENIRLATLTENNQHKKCSLDTAVQEIQGLWCVILMKRRAQSHNHACLYTTKIAALHARDRYSLDIRGDFAHLIFPDDVWSWEQLYPYAVPMLPPTSTTGYYGVSRRKINNNIYYEARLYTGGRSVSTYHKTPEEAAQNYDALARQYGEVRKRLNFPDQA